MDTLGRFNTEKYTILICIIHIHIYVSYKYIIHISLICSVSLALPVSFSHSALPQIISTSLVELTGVFNPISTKLTCSGQKDGLPEMLRSRDGSPLLDPYSGP